jgi:hypothetical protein
MRFRNLRIVFGPFLALFAGTAAVTPSAQAFTIVRANLRGFAFESIRVSLSPANCPASASGELEFAIDLWNKVPGSRLKLERASDTSVAANALGGFNFTETIIVACSANFTTDVPGNPPLDVIGVGTSSDQNTGRLQKGFVLMNEQGGNGRYSTQSAAVRRFTMAHELGHVLGLGHSAVGNALMFNAVSTKEDSNLHQDDMDGIVYLYPLDEVADLYGCGSVAALAAKAGWGSGGGSGGGMGSERSAVRRNLAYGRALWFAALALPLLAFLALRFRRRVLTP